MKIETGWGSHKFVVEHIIKELTNKSVLELGSGDYSTKLIHDLLNDEKSKILTVDTDYSWLEKYLYLKNEKHDFKYFPIEEINSFFESDKNNWGLVFVDSGTWDSRLSAIMKYKDTADYVILHDCDYFANTKMIGETIKPVNQSENDMGIRDYGKNIFKYWVELTLNDWYEYDSWIPPTLLGSNKHPLDNITVDNMIIINKNN